MKVKKDTVLTALLAVLVLVSAVQAVQLMSLSTALANGGVAPKAVSKPVTSASGGSSQGSIPQSLQDLPDMVGGC
ncbi:MAG: hypothetical protein HYY37_05360 [Candidatus Aenigmarchaeota archaeon]|nr:hypothetical protein [Candidatus Aenigmarchaeota archaeon]